MKIHGLTGAVPLTARRLLGLSGADSQPAATDNDDSQTDELTLSPASQGKNAARLAELLKSSDTGPVSVEDVRHEYEQNLARLQSSLQIAFLKNGIETSPEIRLQTAVDGSVKVVGDHPQKAKIEQLFVDDPELRDNFVQVDSQANFIRAADESSAFQRAYTQNPQAALDAFAYLFKADRSPKFQLTANGEQFSETFLEQKNGDAVQPAAS